MNPGDSENDNEIDIPCVGVCIVDDAGYCLGCGRPPAPVADTCAAPRAATAEPSDDQRAALASALSTTLTQ